MVKLKGPSLSAEASGNLADVLAFSHAKGTPYLKYSPAPANPRTKPQISARAIMGWCGSQWKTLTPSQDATWQPLADRRKVSWYHAFTSYNANRWDNFLMPSKEDPATEASVKPFPGTPTAVAGIKCIRIQIIPRVPSPTWGYCLFRDDASMSDQYHDNCVVFIPAAAAGNTYYLDTPLKPGTYWYRYFPFNIDGKAGYPAPQFNATVL